MAAVTRSVTAPQRAAEAAAKAKANGVADVKVAKTTPKRIAKTVSKSKTASKSKSKSKSKTTTTATATATAKAKKTKAKKTVAPAPKATKTKRTGKKTAAAAASSQPDRRGMRARFDLVPKRLLDRFNNYTIAQIKTELRGRDFETTGAKQDLFMRLIGQENRGEDNAADVDSDGDATDQDSDDGSSSCDGSDSPQAENVAPKAFFDCIAFFKGDKFKFAGDKMYIRPRPLPRHFFIPQSLLDTPLHELYDVNDTVDDFGAILLSLVGMNPGYAEMKLGVVLQWHMPERYLIARLVQLAEHGIFPDPPFDKVCSTTWDNKVTNRAWRTAKIMDVVDQAPAFLREWSNAIDDKTLAYPQMPTNYADGFNLQWSFGRALLSTPGLGCLFKRLVAEGTIVLPCGKDDGAVTEEDLVDPDA